MHTRAREICEAARTYEGVPYRHQGRGRNAIDCAGLPIVVAHDLGISGFDTASYSRRPRPHEFDRAMIEAGCTQIPMRDMAPGDILRLAEPRWPVHCAILDEDDRGRRWVIHAYLTARKVIRERYTSGVEARVRSVWRFPEEA